MACKRKNGERALLYGQLSIAGGTLAIGFVAWKENEGSYFETRIAARENFQERKEHLLNGRKPIEAKLLQSSTLNLFDFLSLVVVLKW